MTTAETAGPRRWWLLAVSVSVLLALAIILYCVLFRSGIRVTIQNTGSTHLGSVVLHVTGKSYRLGDIAAGSSATATVNPTSESHLEIEFTDVDSKSKRVNAGGYFEPGYRGTIRVSIKDGAIDENEQQITVW